MKTQIEFTATRVPAPSRHTLPLGRALVGMALLGAWSMGACQVSASGTLDSHTSTAANSGTGTLWASVTSVAGVPTYTSYGGAPAFAPGAFTTGPRFWRTSFPAGQTTGPFAKAAGVGYGLSGDVLGTPIPLGTPSADADAHMLVVNAATVNLSASTDVFIQKDAGAKAADPLYFDAGPNLLEQTISGLSLTGGVGGTGWATGAQTTIPGLESLYSLAVYSMHPISSVADVTVDFRSNPLLGLDDASISSGIRGSLYSVGDTVSLMADYTFDINLDSQSSYALDEEVSAASATDVPEPASLGAAAVGIAGMLARRKRRVR